MFKCINALSKIHKQIWLVENHEITQVEKIELDEKISIKKGQ